MDYDETLTDELIHFGIKGMKWGVRRKRPSGVTTSTGTSTKTPTSTGNQAVKTTRSSTTSKTGEPLADDYKKSRMLRKKGSERLSTKELQELTTRMQLERQYKELNPDKMTRGLKIVKNITAAGTTIASLYALTKTPLGQDIMKALKKGA